MNLNLKWSEPKRLATKRGERLLRTAKASEAFWEAWQADKDALKAEGFSVGKDGGKFIVSHWSDSNDSNDKEAIEASRAEDSDLEIPCPKGQRYFPYQKAGIAYCLKRNNVLLGDSMGLGKSAQAIGLINVDESLEKILIVCPAFLKTNWQREIEKWLVRSADIQIVNGTKKENFPALAESGISIRIINYDIVLPHAHSLHSLTWDLIIADECHSLKNPETNRTVALLGRGAKRGNQKKGIPPKPAVPPVASRRFLALTGTPILNRPIELWPIVNRLAPDEFPNYWGFIKRYCGGGFGFGGSLEKDGASNLDELQRKLRRSIMVRRLKEDVLKDLPAKTRQVIELPPTTEIRRVLDRETQEWELHEDTIAELSRRRVNAELTGDDVAYRESAKAIGEKLKIALNQIAQYRKLCGVMKVPMASHYIAEALDSEEQILVFCHHHEVVDALVEKLKEGKISCSKVHGGVSNDDRQKAVDAFQLGQIRVFVGTIGAAGVGLTLTNARLVIFVELDWTPGKISQAEDRCLDGNQLVMTKQSEDSNCMSLTKIEDIQIGQSIMSGEGKWRKVTDKWSSNKRKQVMASISYYGFKEPIVCTSDHKILVESQSSGSAVWKEAAFIKPGDYLITKRPSPSSFEIKSFELPDEWRLFPKKPEKCIIQDCDGEIEARSKCRIHYREELATGAPCPKAPTNGRYSPLPDIKITKTWLSFFGWYVAEGFSSLSKGKSRFVSLSFHQDERSIAENFGKTLFDPLSINWTIYKCSRGENGIEMRIYSGELAIWFRNWFGHLSKNKALPSQLLNLSPSQSREILMGYLSGDGYHRKSRYEWVSASETLCHQMAILAAKCGYTPCVRSIIHPNKKSTHWIGSFAEGSKSESPYMKRVVQEVSFKMEKRIKVWDITVEEDHSFITGLATVHNCHRIGQSRPVLIQHLVLENSLDSNMVRHVIEKQETIHDALDSKIDMTKTQGATVPPEAVEVRKSSKGTYLAIGEAMSISQRDLAHTAMKLLAKMDGDKARERNGAGFSKIDSLIGNDLAEKLTLSVAQAGLAKKLALKYRNQLPDDIQEKLK